MKKGFNESANSIGPDQPAKSAQADRGLHCLLFINFHHFNQFSPFQRVFLFHDLMGLKTK